MAKVVQPNRSISHATETKLYSFCVSENVVSLALEQWPIVCFVGFLGFANILSCGERK